MRALRAEGERLRWDLRSLAALLCVLRRDSERFSMIGASSRLTSRSLQIGMGPRIQLCHQRPLGLLFQRMAALPRVDSSR